MKFTRYFYVALIGSFLLSCVSGKLPQPFDAENIYEKEVTKEWSEDIGRAYINLAGLGYFNKNDLENQKLKVENLKKNPDIKFESKKIMKDLGILIYSLFFVQKWKHFGTYTGDDEVHKYSFSIIASKEYNKIVCAFSGTNGFKQLQAQYKGREGVQFEPSSGENKEKFKNFKIMEYYAHVFKIMRADFYKIFGEANIFCMDCQIIFTGHSMGGAMASLTIFDLVFSLPLPEKQKSSLALITYGQPRVGNYAFANEISRQIPIIFRHVNKYDVVPFMPACILNQKLCTNEFNQRTLNPEITLETGYTPINNNGIFHPWHFRGLIVSKGNKWTNCVDVSEPRNSNRKEECSVSFSLSAKAHNAYFGYSIPNLCVTSKFPLNYISRPKDFSTYTWNMKNWAGKKMKKPLKELNLVAKKKRRIRKLK